MRLLSRSEIQKIISMKEAIALVKSAFIELSSGLATAPLRLPIEQKKYDGTTLVMPAYLSQSEALAVKIVSVHPHNSEQHLPLINALVVLIDPATGVPLAALEGGFLTALRTGAASGVATDLLACRDAEIAAIFGAGIQAQTQMQAIAAVRPIRRFWIYARHPENIQKLIAEMRPQFDDSVELLPAESPAQAVREAQVICTVTTSKTPVFDGADLRFGVHINAVGSFKPEVQEIDFATLQRAAKIVADSREAVLTEAGDVIVALRNGIIQQSDIYAEIGEIAAGLKPGRENDEEIIYFKSVGNAVQDAIVAQIIYRRALENNSGTEIDLRK